jgi:hypothetical protein
MHRVLERVASRLQAAVRKVCRPLRDVLLLQLPVANLLGGLAADVLRSRGELIAENAILRQQLPHPLAPARVSGVLAAEVETS